MQPLSGEYSLCLFNRQHAKFSDLPVREDVQLNGAASPGNTSRQAQPKEPAQLIEPNHSTLAGTPRLFQHCKSETCHPDNKEDDSLCTIPPTQAVFKPESDSNFPQLLRLKQKRHCSETPGFQMKRDVFHLPQTELQANPVHNKIRTRSLILQWGLRAPFYC